MQGPGARVDQPSCLIYVGSGGITSRDRRLTFSIHPGGHLQPFSVCNKTQSHVFSEHATKEAKGAGRDL
jgi:hypothetical protein